MSHDATSRKVFGVSHETIVRRILRTFDHANASTLEAGARWYDEAGTLAASLAHGDWTPLHVACAIAHLSPRTSWERNVAGTVAMVTRVEDGDDEARRLGCIGAHVDRVVVMMHNHYDNPLDSFGPAARKTKSFARNIHGDREEVTVDVWACRVADLDETLLSRKGAYDAVAHAYRLAARRRGVDPATMQATTWIVARNGRAS